LDIYSCWLGLHFDMWSIPCARKPRSRLGRPQLRKFSELKERRSKDYFADGLPPEHFKLLQTSTFQPFIREDDYYRVQLITGTFEGHAIPDGHVVEILDHRYRIRNMSEAPQNFSLDLATSKEGLDILPGLPEINATGEFQDGTEAFTPHRGPGEDRGEYFEVKRVVNLAPQASIIVDVIIREIRLSRDSEVLICSMPANGVVVDFDVSPLRWTLSGTALWPSATNLRIGPRPGGQGTRFSLPSPVIPGTSIEIKWRTSTAAPPVAEEQGTQN
jgi:hypothetical protein